MIKVSLPTSTEVRQKLEGAKWRLACHHTTGHQRFEVWLKPRKKYAVTEVSLATYRAPEVKGDLGDILEFYTLAGLPIPGYRLVPEDEAEHARGLCLLKAEQCATDGYKEAAESWRRTATALSTQESGEGPVKEVENNG